MKWDFFYEGESDQPYTSITDWYKEVKHLFIPSVVMIALGILLILYLHFSANPIAHE